LRVEEKRLNTQQARSAAQHSTLNNKTNQQQKEYMMHTASEEWAARVAARNEIETAKATRAGEQLTLPFGSGFGESGEIRLLPLSAEGVAK